MSNLAEFQVTVLCWLGLTSDWGTNVSLDPFYKYNVRPRRSMYCVHLTSMILITQCLRIVSLLSDWLAVDDAIIPRFRPEIKDRNEEIFRV